MRQPPFFRRLHSRPSAFVPCGLAIFAATCCLSVFSLRATEPSAGVQDVPTTASQDAPPAEPPKPPRTAQSAVTPVSRSLNRHTEIMARKSQGPIDLIFLGASIMEFWPRRGLDTWAKFAPYNPANFGVGGDCTENVLWRIDNGELDGLHPKVVVVNLGNNNIGGHPDELPEWAAAGARKVIDEVHAKLPTAKILLLDIFPRDGKNSSNRKRNDVVNGLMARFANGDQPRYLRIGHVLLSPSGELIKDVLLPDNLHPTAKGYQLLYGAMVSTLNEMMR